MHDYMNEASYSMDASSLNENDLGKLPLAMAYVPWQKFVKMYDDLEKGYCIGTVFPELNKPFTGRRCV